jgi:hypothetical protein
LLTAQKIRVTLLASNGLEVVAATAIELLLLASAGDPKSIAMSKNNAVSTLLAFMLDR